MGPASGVIASPFRIFPATLLAFCFPYRSGCRPGSESGVRPGRGYFRNGVTTASNSPAGIAPTLR
jgi:hypothetical protein